MRRAYFDRSSWLRIETSFCRGPPHPLLHTPAAYCYIPLSPMPGAGMPYKRSLSQTCLSQARRFCYKPMSRNGRPSLLQTQSFDSHPYKVFSMRGRPPCSENAQDAKASHLPFTPTPSPSKASIEPEPVQSQCQISRAK